MRRNTLPVARAFDPPSMRWAVGLRPRPPGRFGRCGRVGRALIALIATLITGGSAALAADAADAADVAGRQTVMVVLGAEGTPDFGRQFRAWVGRWEQAASRADARFELVGAEPRESGPEDRDRLRDLLAREHKPEASQDTLWLVLIGHGTYDGRQAKFNLRGTDVTAQELATWLLPLTRPMVLINCASSSGPFLKALAAPRRIVLTATKSGQEQNFARWGEYLSSSIASADADLDRDGQTSVLEAYLDACQRVAEFYDQEARLATEHALLDDTGDALGTPADWFQGVRAVKRPQNAKEVDGRRARQVALVRNDVERDLSPEIREQRDSLELELERLRDAKSSLPEAEYFQRLEKICLQLARLYPAR